MQQISTFKEFSINTLIFHILIHPNLLEIDFLIKEFLFKNIFCKSKNYNSKYNNKLLIIDYLSQKWRKKTKHNNNKTTKNSKKVWMKPQKNFLKLKEKNLKKKIKKLQKKKKLLKL